MPKETNQTVNNALRLMECFSDSEELGITELAERIGVAKTAAARLVGSLTEYGYLRQNPGTRKYRLGVRLVYWGNLASERMEIANQLNPLLRQLASEFSLTAHMSVLENNAALIISKVSMGQVVYMSSRVGNSLELHASAMGKCMLAFGPKQWCLEYLETANLVRHTETTIVDKQKLLEECAVIRHKGYAMDREEAHMGLSCLAVPLLDHGGNLVAAISLSGQTRVVNLRMEEIRDRLLSFSRSLF